ncbi:MAG: magnesium chelatase [Candidatus Nitrosocaldaceae archaeon]|nr:MAG: magnesium chelatase [Candidatus Nitrosocaldaceae archaeon]
MSKEEMLELVKNSYDSKPKYDEIEAGVPEDYEDIKTLRDLLDISYKYASINEQLKRNLVRKRKNNEDPYYGIIGYEDYVIPATDRAIIAGHDILYVGEIGQAKTKLAETIAKNLLSKVPVIKGCLVNDIPTTLDKEHLAALLAGEEPIRTSPEFEICKDCEEAIKNNGLDTQIVWKDGYERYRYLLATPDISIKDLVGQIDAIKIAKRGVEIYSIESYSPGQLLQARHGIFCIDELPVLDPRKQVALLSVLQEGRFTTGAYPVIFKPECRIIATANPIDYTHAGKIIEPLFDRLRSHIHTHYPKRLEDEMAIMVQEANIPDENVFLPIFILKILGRITQNLREHPDVNKEKGVSVRISIHALELVLSEAFRTRSIYYDVPAIPRPSDLYAIEQAVKFELSEIDDNRENRMNLLEQVIDDSLAETAREYVEELTNAQVSKIRDEFIDNKIFYTSQTMLGKDGESYQTQLEKFPTLKELVMKVKGKVEKEQKEFIDMLKRYNIDTRILSREDMNGEFLASVTEIVLECLRSLRPPVVDRREGGYATI